METKGWLAVSKVAEMNESESCMFGVIDVNCVGVALVARDGGLPNSSGEGLLVLLCCDKVLNFSSRVAILLVSIPTFSSSCSIFSIAYKSSITDKIIKFIHYG